MLIRISDLEKVRPFVGLSSLERLSCNLTNLRLKFRT